MKSIQWSMVIVMFMLLVFGGCNDKCDIKKIEYSVIENIVTQSIIAKEVTMCRGPNGVECYKFIMKDVKSAGGGK